MNRLAATRFQYTLKSTITQIAIILFVMIKVSSTNSIFQSNENLLFILMQTEFFLSKFTCRSAI